MGHSKEDPDHKLSTRLENEREQRKKLEKELKKLKQQMTKELKKLKQQIRGLEVAQERQLERERVCDPACGE